MSISQSLPTTDPAFRLNFQGARRLDPRVTFSRASTATYVDEDGIVKTAEANQARFAYDPATGESLGLLIEEQRTNDVAYSENFNTWWLTGTIGSVTANSTTSPDGNNNGTLLVNTYSTTFTVNGNTVWYGGQIYKQNFVGPTTGARTWSLFAKAKECDIISIIANTTGGSKQAYFNLSNGTVYFEPSDTTCKIESYPNGWYRCSVTWNQGSSVSYTYNIQVFSSTEITGSDGIYIWGAQLESGSFLTSYISTSGGSITRSADIATFTSQEISTNGTLLSLGGGSPSSPASYNSSEVDTSPLLSNPVITLNSQLSDSSTIPTLLYYPEPISGEAIRAMRAYAPIVKDGLVLHLDAGVDKSYPNSGTIWRDLSGQGNNGALVNGVGYNSNNGGSLVFDGVDDYVDIGNCTDFFPSGFQSHNLSISIWVKLQSTTNNQIFLGQQNRADERLYISSYNGFWDFGWGAYSWNEGASGTLIPSTTNWSNLIFSVSSGVATLYVNGVASINKTDTAVDLQGKIPIGAYFYQNSPDFSIVQSSNISNVLFYNRALSSTEILQNFNASRSRFNI